MAQNERVICASAALVDDGPGVRFEVDDEGGPTPAFVIRHAGEARAYLNRCAHVGVQLDWQQGQFFDPETGLLICATHGALYDPASGICLSGPCRGGRLIPIAVEEHDGRIELKQDS